MRYFEDRFADLLNWTCTSLDSAVATGNKMKTMGSNSTFNSAYNEGSILNGGRVLTEDFSVEVFLEWEELDGGGNAKFHEFYIMMGSATDWAIIAGIQKYSTNVFFTTNIYGSYVNLPDNAPQYNAQYNYNSRAPVGIRITRVSGQVEVYENSLRTGNVWTLIHSAGYTGTISKIILTNTTFQASTDIGGPYCRGYSIWSDFKLAFSGNQRIRLPKRWDILLHQTTTPLVQSTLMNDWITPYTNSSGLFHFEFPTPVQNTNWEQRNYGSAWGPGPWPKLSYYVSLFRPESAWATAVYAGGSIYNGASVCCHGSESNQVMGLRILHEMIHCSGVDSDQMCNGDKVQFGYYLLDISHPDANQFIADPSAFQHDPDLQAVYYQWLIDNNYYTDYLMLEEVETHDQPTQFAFTMILEHLHPMDSLNTWLAAHYHVDEIVRVFDKPAIHMVWTVILEPIRIIDSAVQAIHMRIIHEYVMVRDQSTGFLMHLCSEIVSMIDQLIPAHVAMERVGIRAGDDPVKEAGHDEFGIAVVHDWLDEYGNAVYDRLTDVGRRIINKVLKKTDTEVKVIEQIYIAEEKVIVSDEIEVDL